VRDREQKIKVGLKYCGGCRSRYDRVALVEDLRGRLAEKIEFVPVDSADAEEILIVCGCPAACARAESARPVRYVASQEDAQQWIDEQTARAGKVSSIILDQEGNRPA
jgi:hypothetical protein